MLPVVVAGSIIPNWLWKAGFMIVAVIASTFVLRKGVKAIGLGSPMQFLYSKKPATIYDEQYKPVNRIGSNVRLGEHIESIVGHEITYHGFMYNNKMRYIKDNKAILKAA